MSLVILWEHLTCCFQRKSPYAGARWRTTSTACLCGSMQPAAHWLDGIIFIYTMNAFMVDLAGQIRLNEVSEPDAVSLGRFSNFALFVSAEAWLHCSWCHFKQCFLDNNPLWRFVSCLMWTGFCPGTVPWVCCLSSVKLPDALRASILTQPAERKQRLPARSDSWKASAADTYRDRCVTSCEASDHLAWTEKRGSMSEVAFSAAGHKHDMEE